MKEWGTPTDGYELQWQAEIAIAARFHWTPDQIANLPASFYDELLAFMRAEADRG